MLARLDWLALEVKYVEPARSFYTGHLGLPVASESPGETALAVGETELRLRVPGPVPRGGLHTHFALSTPPEEYGTWWRTLDGTFDLVEHDFGEFRSLYLYDPDGNCVEVGEREGEGSGLTGVFEVALEVESLDRAEAFYRALGGAVVGRGADRRRVRIDLGPVALELWEPQLGIADARGGVHVDLGFRSGDPDAAAAAVRDRACSVESIDGGVRIRDPDGHYLAVRRADG